MRLLVYPHTMEFGGSQLNAIQLAAAMRDRGHDVVVFGEDGPLVAEVHRYGLEHVPLAAGLHRRRPSGAVVRQLRELVVRRGIDVLHGYEWPPIVECYAGPGLCERRPVVGTVMSSAVAPFLPRGLPLTVGTETLRRRTVADGYTSVTLLEPPVDLAADVAPADPGRFRTSYGVDPSVVLAVVVCRLVPELKREGLLAACDAVGRLAADGRPVHLAVVGDGPVRAELTARAAAANALAGRTVVTFTGELSDPRPAYAAADIAIGMGGSALRAMAFGVPLVVQGERGFFDLLTPDTAPRFLEHGWYGLGDGTDGAPKLAALLDRLVGQPRLRQELGEFGRDLVHRRFSLSAAAELQERLYLAARAPGRDLRTVPVAAGLVRYKVARKLARMRGRAAVDDFNSIAAVQTAQSVQTAQPKGVPS